MAQFSLEEYSLSPRRDGKIGKGYIFNNMEFEPGSTQSAALNGAEKGFSCFTPSLREGSDQDVQTLANTFNLMKLDTKLHLDYTKEEFEQTLQKIADIEVKADDKCLVMAIMTHGNEKRIRLKDEEYELNEVFETINNCRNLKGKPKIFIIQACRGHAKNIVGTDRDISGNTEVNVVTEDSPVAQLVPKGSDILACYATSNGYVSYRDTRLGSFFIRTIGNLLNDYLEGDYIYEEFLIIMTKVSCEVAKLCFGEGKIYKQMPTIVSTLRKRLKFPSLYNKESDNLKEDIITMKQQIEALQKKDDDRTKRLKVAQVSNGGISALDLDQVALDSHLIEATASTSSNEKDEEFSSIPPTDIDI